MTTAINVFLRQSIRTKGFPFEVNLYAPNKHTIETMNNTQSSIDMHGPFDTVDELISSLDADN